MLNATRREVSPLFSAYLGGICFHNKNIVKKTGGLLTSKDVWRSTVLKSHLNLSSATHCCVTLDTCLSLTEYPQPPPWNINKKVQTGADSFSPKCLTALRQKWTLCPFYRRDNWGTGQLSNLPKVIELESGRNRIQNPGRTSVLNTHFCPLLFPSLNLSLVTFHCHLSSWENLECWRAKRGLNSPQENHGGESFHC